MGTLGEEPRTFPQRQWPIRLRLSWRLAIHLYYRCIIIFRDAVSFVDLRADLTSRPLHPPRYLGSAPSPILLAGLSSCALAFKDHVDGGTVAERGSHPTIKWT